MADIVGLVSNILQLIQFSTAVYERLEECASSIKNLPAALDGILNRMPVLLKALQNTKMAVDTGAVHEQSRSALRRAIRGCESQMNELSAIVDKVIPPSGASKLVRTWKALGSMRYDAKVERIDDQIQKYVNVLSHHHSTANYVKVEGRPPPTPCSTVPYREDMNFVDRKLLTAQLAAKCEEPAARVALVGVGGVGKSQLAIDYAHKLQKSSPDTWVFWINADNAATFEKGFEEIADTAHIYAYDQTDPQRMHTVKRWLMEKKHKWLIILDNADDLKALVPEDDPLKHSKKKGSGLGNTPKQDLLSLLPQTPNGRYIVTSRDKQAATRIVLGEYHNVIEVKEMDEDDALSLLTRKLVETPNEDEANALVEALGRMPLAISTAAAFINEMQPRWSVARYTEEYRKGDDERMYLLEKDVYDARRETEDRRSNSIVRTWRISFDYIRKYRPSAARLLSLMSLFHPHSIPEYMLIGEYIEDTKDAKDRLLRWYNRANRKRKNKNALCSEEDFEEDWRMLNRFSLIDTTIDGHHFSMHKLMQASTKRWLQLNGDLERWIHRYLELLNDIYEKDVPEADTPDFLLHAYYSFIWQPSEKKTLGIYALLVYKIAFRYSWAHTIEERELFYRVSVCLLATVYGRRHRDTLMAAMAFADFYIQHGRPEEAEGLYRMVLQARIKMLGLKHLDTLDCMDKIGFALGEQGKYEEGNMVFERAMEIRQRKYGIDHPATIWAMDARRTGMILQYRYEELVEESRRAYEARKRMAGDAYDSIWCKEVEPIAALLLLKGQAKKAESLYNEILSHKECHLGETHEETLATVEGLCGVPLSQEKWAEVEILCMRLLTHWPARRREDKIDTMAKLTYAFLRQNKLKETEVLARSFLEESIEVFGAQSDEATMATLLLGSSLRKQEKYDEALPFLETACNRAEEAWGADSRDTQEALKELSRLKVGMSAREPAVASSTARIDNHLSVTLEGISDGDLEFQTSCTPQ